MDGYMKENMQLPSVMGGKNTEGKKAIITKQFCILGHTSLSF